MIRQNDLDKNKVHFGLFMRALKDAPADKVTVQVEGTEIGFCGDVLAGEIGRLLDELKLERSRVAFYRERYDRMEMYLKTIKRLRRDMLDWEGEN